MTKERIVQVRHDKALGKTFLTPAKGREFPFPDQGASTIFRIDWNRLDIGGIDDNWNAPDDIWFDAKQALEKPDEANWWQSVSFTRTWIFAAAANQRFRVGAQAFHVPEGVRLPWDNFVAELQVRNYNNSQMIWVVSYKTQGNFDATKKFFRWTSPEDGNFSPIGTDLTVVDPQPGDSGYGGESIKSTAGGVFFCTLNISFTPQPV